MLDRFNPALRILCLVLAAIVVAQLARLAGQSRSLPEPPTEAFSLPAPSLASGPQSTNAAPNAGATNPGATSPAVARGPGAAPGVSPGPSLPAHVQARVERITQSEILGPVVRPLPMALLGIAGLDAIVRTPDGRTGLLRVGEELGGVKLLQIGTNRVLIEHEKQRKELMLFSGFGSDSLLPTTKQDSK